MAFSQSVSSCSCICSSSSSRGAMMVSKRPNSISGVVLSPRISEALTLDAHPLLFGDWSFAAVSPSAGLKRCDGVRAVRCLNLRSDDRRWRTFKRCQATRLPGDMGPMRRPTDMNTGISPPGLGQFRPPPNTYVPHYEESEEEKQEAALKKNSLVEKLLEGYNTWQERAGFVTELQELGVTSEELYGMTFVPIVKQLEIVVAAQVFESLVKSGTSPEVLQHFDESSLTLLYKLRTLSAAQRRAAAEFVVENSLTIEETEQLAWAIKDHERRGTGRMGFTAVPGDCLAFMYHRQAKESRDQELRDDFIEKGMRVAVSDSARQRFSEFPAAKS